MSAGFFLSIFACDTGAITATMTTAATAAIRRCVLDLSWPHVSAPVVATPAVSTIASFSSSSILLGTGSRSWARTAPVLPGERASAIATAAAHLLSERIVLT